jgi:hypothetical protein
MADRVIKILTKATATSFLSLAEAKSLLNITSSTPESDAQLQLQLEIASQTMMRKLNRILARQRVRETWRDLGTRRLFLSHFPVNEFEIEEVWAGGAVLPYGSYELEEGSGKLSCFPSWPEDVVVTYWGGYVLPDDAPFPLKQICSMMTGLARQQQSSASSAVAAGIKSIMHKGKRIQFETGSTSTTSSSGGPSAGSIQQAVDDLLNHYRHIEV